MKKHLLKSNKLINSLRYIFASLMLFVSVFSAYTSYAQDPTGFYDNVIQDKTVITDEFVQIVVSYGKIILLLLIFIAIIYAAFKHMIYSATSPEQRVKTIETFRRIFAGILIFLVLAALVGFMTNFLDKGYEFMDSITESYGDGFLDNDDKITTQSALLDLIETLVNVYNSIMNGIIEMLMKQMDSSVQGVDYLCLIYDVYDSSGEVSKMKPFDEAGVEWTRLMSGYNALVGISFLLLIFVFVKTAIEFVLYSGNEKKLVEVKESWIRILWAVILMISLPYLVQLLLYLFNYMTAAIPINFQDNRFDFDIQFDGVLGSLAQCVMITTKWNIYMTFYVRHVMLDLLVVSGPIVCAVWAVGKKFKSFPLWLGELFTNIATQFCYALGFLMIILLSFHGENGLYGLILVMTATQLSKFVKDSLQGFLLAGAGIDEEAVGAGIVAKVFGWGRKAKGFTKKSISNVGRFAQKVDPKMQTKTWRGAYNASQIMQGKLGNIRFAQGKTQKQLAKERELIQNKIDNLDDEVEREEAQEYLEAIVNKRPVARKTEGTNGIFDDINEYKISLLNKTSKIKEKKDAIDNWREQKNVERTAKHYGADIEDSMYVAEANEEFADLMEKVTETADDEKEMTKELAQEKMQAVTKNVDFALSHFMAHYVTEEAEVRNAELEDMNQTLHNLELLDAEFFSGRNKEALDVMQEKIAERLALQLAANNGSDEGGIKIKISVKGLNDLMTIQSNETYDKGIKSAAKHGNPNDGPGGGFDS